MDIQLERLHNLALNGTTFWFIGAKHPGVCLAASKIIGSAVARLSQTELHELRTKVVAFSHGQSMTTDPMTAFALLNAKPEFGIVPADKWEKSIPGGRVTFVKPPTNEPDAVEEPEPEPEHEDEPQMVSEMVAPQPSPELEPQFVKVAIRPKRGGARPKGVRTRQ